jgi:hypothetical protein
MKVYYLILILQPIVPTTILPLVNKSLKLNFIKHYVKANQLQSRRNLNILLFDLGCNSTKYIFQK